MAKNIKSKNAKLTELSVAKYNLKIVWAKQQPKNKKVRRIDMMYEIRIDWFSDYCDFCDAYVDERKGCSKCPLSEFYKDRKTDTTTYEGVLTDWCCFGLWIKMNHSKTWGEWVERAEDVLEFIKKNGDR